MPCSTLPWQRRLLRRGVIRTAAADPGALQVRAKRPNDFVTQVDLASERVIVQTLLGAFPQHAVRSEESTRLHGNADADHVWIVDPLDGTNNFIHGYPAYAVSIALAVRGRVEVGVVLDVTRGDVLPGHARRRRLVQRRSGWPVSSARPSSTARGRRHELPVPPRPGLRRCDADARRGDGARAAPCAARARPRSTWPGWPPGRCDASFDLGLNAWDVAAGGLLVQRSRRPGHAPLAAKPTSWKPGNAWPPTRRCMPGAGVAAAALCSAAVAPHEWSLILLPAAMSSIRLVNVSKHWAGRRRSTRIDLDDRAGQLLRAARPVGLRQVDHAAHHRRARIGEQRARC